MKLSDHWTRWLKQSKCKAVRHVDRRDAQSSDALSMSRAATIVLPPPLLEYDDLISEGLLLNNSGHVAVLNKGSADDGGRCRADEKDVVELHFLAYSARHCRCHYFVRRHDLVLRSKNTDDSKGTRLRDDGETSRGQRFHGTS